MLKRSAVVLIAPLVAQDLARAEEERREPEALTRMAGRGELRSLQGLADLDPWRVGLLAALGLPKAPEQYPEGPVMAAAAGCDAQACWLRATPLHFAAGLNDLAASALSGAYAMSEDEQAQLGATLCAHLQRSGFDLITVGGQWIVRAPQALQAVTMRPEIALRDLANAMPTGPDARALRRLMSELQMLLHEHAVNRQRARVGAPEVNAIWLHGLGSIEPASQTDLPEAFGDDVYLSGLYRLHGRQVRAPVSHADELLSHRSGSALAVLDVATLEALETQWLTPLLRALRGRLIDSLDLVLARWRITLERGASLKFWRGARPLARWPA